LLGKKNVFFLPPLAATPADKKVKKQEVPLELNQKAAYAAQKGFFYLLEEYRKRGANIIAFARGVGIAGNVRYAELLVNQNPQLGVDLVDELTLGFYAGGHTKMAADFSEKYRSRFFLNLQKHQHRFLRREGSADVLLRARFQQAINEGQRNRSHKKPEIAFSSSEESFGLD